MNVTCTEWTTGIIETWKNKGRCYFGLQLTYFACSSL